MKRLWIVAIVLLALPSVAQIRGVPASVTSQTQWRSTPGIPASVTSLGPNGYGHTRNFSGGFNNYNNFCSTPGALIPSAMGCTSTYFTNPMYGLPANTPPTNLHARKGRGRGNSGGYYPVYVPYAVPVIAEEEPTPDAVAAEEELQEPPALTVFERRPRTAVTATAVPIDESRVYHPSPNAAVAEQQDERQAPAIVLIYKDGHQREVQNYAIMGANLYDIGSFVAQKIPLAELNLKATVKANDERGVEFSLPARVAP